MKLLRFSKASTYTSAGIHGHYLLSALANGFNHIEKLSKYLLFALPSFGERRISPFYDLLGTFTRINYYYYHDAPCRF